MPPIGRRYFAETSQHPPSNSTLDSTRNKIETIMRGCDGGILMILPLSQYANYISVIQRLESRVEYINLLKFDEYDVQHTGA